MKGIRLTIEEIQDMVDYKKLNIKVLKEINDTNGKSRKVKCKCLNESCGHIWDSMVSNLCRKNKKNGCPACAGRVVTSKNSLKYKRPDLMIYLKNKSDGDNYTCKSSKKIKLTCPKCGLEKTLAIVDLNRNGFSCKNCNTKPTIKNPIMSLNERFCMHLLKNIGVEFEYQKSFDWIKGKAYDFYIPSLNIIIETHGRQHYMNTAFVQTLEQQIAIDNEKRDLALKNNISKYIEINCMYGNEQYIINSFITSLESIFDLSNIVWGDIWINSQPNIFFEICDYWNKKDVSNTTNDASLKFNLSTSTIIKYLKIGTKYNICEYDGVVEMIKNAKINGGKNKVNVYQYDMFGNFIKKFESAIEIETQLGILRTCISECCSGRTKSSHNFIWSHNPPTNGVLEGYDVFNSGNMAFKTVLQYDLNKKLLNRYYSVKNASELTGIKAHNIAACCRKEQRTSGGFIWEYE